MISKKVYVSGSGFFAFIDRAHPKHDQANAYFRYFAQEGYSLFTDSMTLIGVYNQIYKDISPSLARDFLRTISWRHQHNLSRRKGYKIRAKNSNKLSVKITDLFPSLRAVLANRRGISQVFTFDYLHPLFGSSVFYLPI